MNFDECPPPLNMSPERSYHNYHKEYGGTVLYQSWQKLMLYEPGRHQNNYSEFKAKKPYDIIMGLYNICLMNQSPFLKDTV